jgi:hypothetical protein
MYSDTLTSADATPASRAGTSAMAIVSSGMNAVPAPRPISRKATKTVGK